MSTGFNVNQYWLRRGKTYRQEQRLGLEYHRLQERFLVDVLRQSELPMGTILELGCGFGRVTRLLAENFPSARITALDLSPEQLENARRHCAGSPNVRFGQYDFYSDLALPGTDYDVAMAIEVFLHHPRPIIRSLVERLAAAAKFVVNLDWSEDWPWKLPEHVWIHDYEALYREVGLNCTVIPLPQKVDGKQQRLFIAGRVPPAVGRRRDQPGKEAGAGRGVDPNDISSPSGDWLQQLQRAQKEIRELIPTGGTFILVNDDQWGNEPEPGNRCAMPFLEKNGQYWGPPADDATALSELERLRSAGASFIVFAWPSFWWLDHYAGLRQHLSTLPCVLKNDRLIAFKLNA